MDPLRHQQRRRRRKDTDDHRRPSHKESRRTETQASGNTDEGTKRGSGREERKSRSTPKRSVSRAQRRSSTSDLPSSKMKSPAKERPVSTAARRPDASNAGEPLRPKSEPPKNEKRSSGFMHTLFGSGSPTAEKKITCLTCFSDDIPISRSAKLACSHRMCYACLKRIFVMSVTDPQHMPPRCCTTHHIPLKHVDKLFDTKFKKQWNKKYEEYMTKNRIYCPSKGCGEWIKPDNFHEDISGRRFGKCARCKTKVCMTCNGKWHRGKECPKDEGTQRFVEIAEREGWQKCYNCSAMVELKEGCNHMTCRCTAEFCILCGKKWKTCECPWFNYENMDGEVLNEMNVTDARRNELRRQMEVERRREQERQDELMARRLQRGLTIDDDEGMNDDFDNYNHLPDLRTRRGVLNPHAPFEIDDFPSSPGSHGAQTPPTHRPRRNRPDSPVQDAYMPGEDMVYSPPPRRQSSRPSRRRGSMFRSFFDEPSTRPRRNRDSTTALRRGLRESRGGEERLVWVSDEMTA